MTERIFDFAGQRQEAYPESILLAAKNGADWRTYTAREVWETACGLSDGLLRLGIDNTVMEPEAQEKIAIISPNRPEWIIADLAVQLTGAILTPIYPTINPAELIFVLKEAGVRKIFIAGEELYLRFRDALSATAALQHIITFDKVEGVWHWKDLITTRTEPDKAILARIRPETVASIIYTSGTTGDPKGVMLTHHNIASNVRDSMPAFTFAKRGERALSFLPLNHIFERMVTYIYIDAGISIYYAQSMDTIGENLREVQPMVFTTVPRLLEKVYERILNKGLEQKGIKRKLFFWALDLGKKYNNAAPGNLWYRLQLAIANRLVFSKWREALGGKVKAIVTGSAACQERLIRIFTAARVIIMEGYGLTETSPVVTVNRFESEGRRMGTVGTLIDNVEVKIAEDGEILCKGPNIMFGYYKRPEMTAAAVHDGWFHTGDIGEWVDGKFLKITDRKKEIFKTSGGKYVAPQVIENKMRESPYIEQMMVIGNNRKFVGALIVPSFMQLRKWLEDHHQQAPESNAALIAMPEAQRLITEQVEKYNPLFNHVEQIKKWSLLPAEWTIDGGELTPKLSLKRKAVEAKYAAQIEALYA